MVFCIIKFQGSRKWNFCYGQDVAKNAFKRTAFKKTIKNLLTLP